MATVSTPQKRPLPSAKANTTIVMPSTSPVPPAITVVVKIRPPNQRELDLAKTSPQTSALNFHSLSENNQAITLDPVHPPNKPSWSHFDNIFDSESDQIELFEGTAMPIVGACLQGYNGCLMAYGQTGSGKTFSMTGPKDCLMNPAHHHLQGVIPRSLNYLFDKTKEMEGTKCQVQCSYFEIYNDALHDLLLPVGTAATSLTIGAPGPSNIVSGLTMIEIGSASEAIAVMEKGFAKRHTAATKMNNESSRSHAIFTIYLKARSKSAKTGNTIEQFSKLHFVDLAGSESAGKTGATGDTQREGGNINASLLNLGKVIRDLVSYEQTITKKKATNATPAAVLQPYISYRASKLTHFLQDSFGKGNPLCLIANISPSRDNSQESRSTLAFASGARSLPKTVVKPKAKVLVNNGANGTGPNGDGDDTGDGLGDAGDDYSCILRARYGNKVDLLDAMLEQAYHTAVLWKRQRIGTYLQQLDEEND